ncbi:MAG: hypothetical protein AB1938_01025 [Myxococcota bacterium]
MDLHEAVMQIRGKRLALARRLRLLSGLTMAASALLLGWAASQTFPAPRIATWEYFLIAASLVVGIGLPLSRLLINRAIASRTLQWIDEVAEGHGVSRGALNEVFVRALY